MRYAHKHLIWLAAGLAGATTAALSFPTPIGPMPYGVYDPHGNFTDETDVQYEHLFLPWEDLFLGSLKEADAYALARKRDVLVTIEPWTWSRNERNTPARLLSGIQSGEYDDNMATICAELAGFKSDVTVRWAQEMDDKSGQFIWAQWPPETYAQSFRRMIDVCRDEAPDIKVMWSPLGNEDLADFYPGDDYVDIVGLSVFGLQSWEEDTQGGAKDFDAIFAPRYSRVEGFGKPVMVAELGFSGDADYVARWENRIRDENAAYPELEAILYFNQQEVYPWPDGYGFPNWRVDYRIGTPDQSPPVTN